MYPCDCKNKCYVQLNHTDITIEYCPRCHVMKLVKNDYNDTVFIESKIVEGSQKQILMYLFK